jgi:hypothetical protein
MLKAERPGSWAAIAVHLFPDTACDRMRIASSSGNQPSLETVGASCPIQRSLHCLPVRVGTRSAMAFHESIPQTRIASRSCPSSSGVHLAFRGKVREKEQIGKDADIVMILNVVFIQLIVLRSILWIFEPDPVRVVEKLSS